MISVPPAFQVIECRILVLRAPVAEPVRTAFGTMKDRPVVLVALTDDDGNTGWGEAWCNFPSCGAEHRARLIETEIAPLLLGRQITDPSETFAELTSLLHLLVKQTGEGGPVAQAIAGVDIALWDLAAQRASQPLWRYLGGSSNTVSAYASGINPNEPQRLAKSKQEQGYTAFKLKVGFGDSLDISNVRAMRETLGAGAKLMIDANQAWGIDNARSMIDSLSKFDLTWVEEPLPVDASDEEWRTLATASPVPLAGGENLRGFSAYRDAISSRYLAYIQPDVAKWGGISGCFSVAKETRAAGLTYCPHWLGSGVGLLASAHLLAAAGGNGLLEVDANPNPLRDELINVMPTVENGRWQIGTESGLGVRPRQDVLERYGVFESRQTA